MKMKIFITIFASLMLSTIVLGQRTPPPPGAPRGDGPPRAGRPGEMGPNRPEGQPPGDWINPHDINKNGNFELEEFQAAMDRTFAELDKDGNGTLDASELKRGPKPGQRPMPNGEGPPPPQRIQGLAPNAQRPGGEGKPLLPPFFFNDKVEGGKSVTRAEFDQLVRGVFSSMDKNGDGTLTRDEARKTPRPDGPPNPGGPPPPPNARFIGAELRFGDKLVKGQPFSADTIIEDTRLLFDGSTVKKAVTGAIYRDSSGRTRREQPLEMVGGVNVVGAGNKAQKLVFINDFGSRTQYFLDQNNRVARKSRTPDNTPPPDMDDRPGAKIVSDGTKTIEGVTCNLTRTEFEIPAGQLGNDKPLKVVSEKCFSPELQVVIMSSHNDPVSGLHVFKLTNIKRTEPAADLFTVPSDYRIENHVDRAPERQD